MAKKKKDLIQYKIRNYTVECEPKDIEKYEVADELGLLDKVMKGGWKQLSAREAGRIGGVIGSRVKKAKL